MTLELSGRTAVVTGAASGIGAALARHAANLGMAVAACDRDRTGLEALSTELTAAGVPHLVAPVDVTNEAALAAFAAEAAATLPPIALLFANAGVLRGGPLLTMTAAEWDLLLGVNVGGTMATIRAFAPAMTANAAPSRIVVTGSTGSMLTAPGLAAYCATKHALWPLAEALAAELAATPVGVSLLMPGAVATRIFAATDPDRTAPADSISPEEAAAITFTGAIAGNAKILTHPAYADRIGARFARTVEELADHPLAT